MILRRTVSYARPPASGYVASEEESGVTRSAQHALPLEALTLQVRCAATVRRVPSNDAGVMSVGSTELPPRRESLGQPGTGL
jgi:hypothetical protein